ncbi:MAG: hypothetical protein JO359_14640 [Candidatus Eremiobacteraeota bacterium]|nr:hypothetical protein [Candidatus Eremiobacteraeota bacterium]
MSTARAVASLAGVLALSSCGGGSSTPSAALPTASPAPTAFVFKPIPTSSPAGAPLGNVFTTYAVYTGSLDVLGPSVGIAALADGAPPPGLQAPTPAAGAFVYYPDGSQQVADAQGNFDASQSSWAVTNFNALLNDPTLEPEVIITAQPPGSFPALDTFVDAFQPGGPVSAAVLRKPETTTPPTVAKLYVAPASISLFDVQTQAFYATGADAGGKRVSLSGTPVAWSLTVPSGCSGGAAGSITPSKGDGAKATYRAPSSGTSTAACPDLVIASVTAGSTTLSAQGQVSYRDPHVTVKVSGTLTDTTNKALVGALLELFGNTPDAVNGKVDTTTGAGGAWSANVDAGRTLAPIAAVTINKKQQYYPVQPASIPVPASGLSGLHLVAQVALPTAKPTPLPKPSPKPTSTPKTTPSATPRPSTSPSPTASSTPSQSPSPTATH